MPSKDKERPPKRLLSETPLASPRAVVVVADPNWAYDNWADAKRGAARAHYACSPVDQLKRLPVGNWVAEHSIMALWAVWPKVDEAVDLMRAWGYSLVTGFPWVKTTADGLTVRSGCGFWTRAASELVLIGRRSSKKGSACLPRTKASFVGTSRGGRKASPKPVGLLEGPLAGGLKVDAQFWAPRGKHSAKPEGIQDYLERRYDGPYLELFARRQRQGWTCWGDELGVSLEANGAFPCEPVRSRDDESPDEGEF